MADNERSLVRRIVAIFDRASGKRVEAELEGSLAKAGAKGGDNFVRELRAAFDKRTAELKVALAKGLIDPAQFRKLSADAARQFNTGIIAGLEKARAAGNLTDKEFQKLARTLKTVGTTGSTAGKTIGASFRSALAPLAAFFGLWRTFFFAVESSKAAIEEKKAFDALAATLANVGIAYADVADEITATQRALEDSAAVTDDEVATALSRLVLITGDYKRSLAEVGLVADIAAKQNISLDAAATLVGKAMVGNVKALKQFGITTKDAGEAMDQLHQKFDGFAASTIPASERLTKQWGEFKEALGRALLALIGGDTGFKNLTETIKDATRWLEDNEAGFANWGRVALLTIQAVWQALLLIPRTLNNVSTVIAEGLAAMINAGSDPMNFIRMSTAWNQLNKDFGNFDATTQELADNLGVALGLLKRWTPEVVSTGRAVQDFTGDLDENTRAVEENNAAKAPPADIEKGADPVFFPERFRTPDEEFKLADEDDLQRNADLAESFKTPWMIGMEQIRAQVDAERGLFAELGEAWAQGGVAGLAFLAKAKVRENFARVIEETAKGFGALFLNPAAAAAHFKSAATHVAAAAAWKALGGATGGGGGSGSGGGAPGGGGPNTGRAAASQVRGADVSIYLTGPGFDALNPTVQRVVYGAQQMARERFGENANITVRRSS